MRYKEILRETSEQTQRLLSILEPLAADGKESISITDFIALVNHSNMTSMLMDREAVMQLLEPSDDGLVKSIDGDMIYFGKTITPIRDIASKQQEKESESLDKNAARQATKILGSTNLTSNDRATAHSLSVMKHL
jgi:cell division septum initiation protein DivIVA